MTTVTRTNSYRYMAIIPRVLALSAGTCIALGIPVTARGQGLDDSTTFAAQRAAAQRIVGVRLTPSSLQLAVGDTAELKVELIDQAGHAVSVETPNGTPHQPRYYLVSPGITILGGPYAALESPASLRIIAHAVSHRADVQLYFPRVSGPGLDSRSYPVPITVTERPTVRMTLTPGPGSPVVGTRLRLSATVWKQGSQWSDPAPVITWLSSDPAVASVATDGTVMFHRAGHAQISAANGGAQAVQAFDVRAVPLTRMTLDADRHTVRTGDVVHLTVRAWDRRGTLVPDAPVNLAVSSDASSSARAGASTYDDRTFVAEEPGVYTIVAELEGVAARTIVVAEPRAVGAKVEVLSHVPALHDLASEVMVFEGLDHRDYAYLGYLGSTGNRLHCFDVTDPAHPVLTDSVLTDAHSINDVRVDTEWGPHLGVFTKEGASDRKNGIVLLDVTHPAHPVKLSEFTETTVGGVHNAWIAGTRVYLANDGTGDLHIVDVTDPRHPKESGRWSTGTPGRYLHDMIVQDGIAYLAYWDDGLIILDVGGAGKGGTPDVPVVVSRYAYGPGSHTHNVFRYKQYLFVGDEGPDFIPHPVNGSSGYIHVLDLSDLAHPREVAKYYPPEAGTHNAWAERDTLYIAYYQGGLRVVDVSGEMRGDLYQQGRQIAWYDTGAGVGEAFVPNRPFGAAPQYYKGNVFFADFYSGFWIMRVVPKPPSR